MREELRRRAALHHQAAVQHADLVAQVVDHRQVVADEQIAHAELLLQVLHEVEHLGLHRHIERAHRLVGHDELGPGDEGARDGDALALAAGELVRVLVQVGAAQAHRRQRFGGALALLGASGGRERVYRVLEEVGLTEALFPGLLGRYPHEFSGGQRQRLAIARALIVQPQLLVLDEPTSALDVTIQKQVLALLQRLQRERGLSYLLITHDVEVIRAMAHRVMVMKDGAVLEAGEVGRVLDSPQDPYTRKLVAAALDV